MAYEIRMDGKDLRWVLMKGIPVPVGYDSRLNIISHIAYERPINGHTCIGKFLHQLGSFVEPIVLKTHIYAVQSQKWYHYWGSSKVIGDTPKQTILSLPILGGQITTMALFGLLITHRSWSAQLMTSPLYNYLSY